MTTSPATKRPCEICGGPAPLTQDDSSHDDCGAPTTTTVKVGDYARGIDRAGQVVEGKVHAIRNMKRTGKVYATIGATTGIRIETVEVLDR